MDRNLDRAGTVLGPSRRKLTTVGGSSEVPRPSWSQERSSSPRDNSPVKGRSISNTSQIKPRRIRRRQAMHIASQLAVMIDVGIGLPEALESLAKQSSKPYLREALSAIRQSVTSGNDVSQTFSTCPHKFPMIFSPMLRASEASGTMGTMLSRVADYLREEDENVRKIRSALIYPAAMLGLCLLTIVLMIAFLLPRFSKIYRGHEDVLPLPTRIAFAFSHYFLANWIYIVTAIVLLIGGMVVYLRSPAGRRNLEWLKLHLPLVGRMFQKFYLTRSIRTIGTMLTCGKTIPEAVDLAKGVSGSPYFDELWKGAGQRLREGAPFYDRLFNSPLIPNTVAQMIATGEKTGRLALVLERISTFCESELQISIKNVTTILEPLMIIIMGLIVAGIAMAVLLPIFSISKILGS